MVMVMEEEGNQKKGAKETTKGRKRIGVKQGLQKEGKNERDIKERKGKGRE